MFVPCSQSQLTVLWVNHQPPPEQTGSRTALHTLAWLSTKPLKPPIELPQRPHPGTPVWRQDTGHTDRPKPRAPECPTCRLTHGTARRCTAAVGRRLCGAALRDTIVNFGDPLPAAHLDAATRHAEQSDLMLCLGSTLQVTPACNLVKRSKHPLGLIIANRQVTPLDERCQRPRPSPRRRSATAPNPAPDPPLPTTFGVRYFGDCDRLLRRVMARLLPAEELAAWDTERVRRAPLYAAQRAEP
eukprot:EG_transcript_18946